MTRHRETLEAGFYVFVVFVARLHAPKLSHPPRSCTVAGHRSRDLVGFSQEVQQLSPLIAGARPPPVSPAGPLG